MSSRRASMTKSSTRPSMPNGSSTSFPVSSGHLINSSAASRAPSSNDPNLLPNSSTMRRPSSPTYSTATSGSDSSQRSATLVGPTARPKEEPPSFLLSQPRSTSTFSVSPSPSTTTTTTTTTAAAATTTRRKRANEGEDRDAKEAAKNKKGR